MSRRGLGCLRLARAYPEGIEEWTEKLTLCALGITPTGCNHPAFTNVTHGNHIAVVTPTARQPLTTGSHD